MEKFKELVDEVNRAAIEADKFYVNENMQAGKRFYSSLMNISRLCKAAREELSISRKEVRIKRNIK